MIRDGFCFSFLYRGLASDAQWFNVDGRSDLDLMTLKYEQRYIDRWAKLRNDHLCLSLSALKKN